MAFKCKPYYLEAVEGIKCGIVFQDLFLRITCGGLVTALAVTSDGAYCAVATSMMIKIWQVWWLSCTQ